MNDNPAVLLIDDDPAIRRILVNELRHNGIVVEAVPDAETARSRLRETLPDVAILDARLPGMPGEEFLREVATLSPETRVIMLTGHADVEMAVRCMKDGAADFIAKPCSVEHLSLAIRRAAEIGRLRAANATLARCAKPARPAIGSIIGESEPIRRLRSLIGKVAATDETILIRGESGTGKELIANEIQRLSRRSSKPFIAVNCAAVAETLLESELFGHEKGAFSGAVERRLGFFELADEGTIFLDEIGDMPMSMQPKLLRVLQSGEVRRVGGARAITVNARVIAATNRALDDEVREGTFREDLMHRVNAITLEAPPLRDRPDDIDLLASHFLLEAASNLDRPKLEMSDEALAALRAYAWPGNVRELRNAVRRAAILSDADRIEPGDLPPAVAAGGWSGASESGGDGAATDPLSTPLAEVERRHILAVLAHCGGNKTQASKRLGISVKTLYNKLEAWGMSGR